MWEVFEALLKARGITAADFSRATGISQATLSTWKKRGTPIGSRHAQTIADYFAVPVDFLMTGKAETPDLRASKKSPLFKQITGFSNSIFRPFIFRLPKPRLKPLNYSKFLGQNRTN